MLILNHRFSRGPYMRMEWILYTLDNLKADFPLKVLIIALLNLGKHADTSTVGRVSHYLPFLRILMMNQLNTKWTTGAYVLCKASSTILVILIETEDSVWPTVFSSFSLPDRCGNNQRTWEILSNKWGEKWANGILLSTCSVSRLTDVKILPYFHLFSLSLRELNEMET